MGNGLLAAALLIYSSSALLVFLASSSPLQDPHLVVQDVNRRVNAASVGRKLLESSPSGGCKTGNLIDDCWRCGSDWTKDRGRLADCAVGFGAGAKGGAAAADRPYVVTNEGDDVSNPSPGTLRYAVIQPGPMWITFAGDMTIKLKDELVMTQPFKTIDGRGANVHIAGGPCFNIHMTSNIIIHGISIHDCTVGGDEDIAISPGKVGHYTRSDGDGIQVFQSSHIWIDHCYFSKCVDGLLDVMEGSSDVTISNNFFTNHDKVMLLGASDDYAPDKNMRVTVAYNVFGPGLIQRMPRCRLGIFHVVNNHYPNGWGKYAIGGSANPTIVSQANIFVAPSNPYHHEVTSREDVPESEYRSWNWESNGDLMVGGAFFKASGASNTSSVYSKAGSVDAKPSDAVPDITKLAGPI